MNDSTAISPALNRILVCTDLSPESANLLAYAAQFYLRFGVQLCVMHVLHTDVCPFQLPETWPQMKDAETEACQRAESLIRSTLGSIPHEMILEKGEVWPTIRKIIREKRIDLLIAGTHDRSGISKAIIGSVAEQIILNADCPALTIGPNVPVSHGLQLQFNRILYATDLSMASLSAVPFVVCLCKRSGARLTLLYCYETGEVIEGMLETLPEVIPLGAGLNSSPECLVKASHHRNAILEVAHQQESNVIMLGVPRAKWHAKLATHFTDSTTYQIISQAECAVLTIRN